MDTRSKIVEADALQPGAGNLHAARGWFDVLTAEHCDLLASCKPAEGELLVLVYREASGRPSPLSAFDRAQMVASLACVDRVCVCDASEAVALAGGIGATSETDIDAVATRDVIRDVLDGH